MTLSKTSKATQGKPLAQSRTTIETWFERDRQHVELRDGRNDQTIIEWWDDDVTQAVEDGFLKPHDYHTAAYEYAKYLGCLPIVPSHFIGGSGEHGCLYDSCGVYHSLVDAVEGLADMFSLGRTRKATLKKNRTLELNPSRDGAEYCEITRCDCDEPWTHDDQMTENDWED